MCAELGNILKNIFLIRELPSKEFFLVDFFFPNKGRIGNYFIWLFMGARRCHLSKRHSLSIQARVISHFVLHLVYVVLLS